MKILSSLLVSLCILCSGCSSREAYDPVVYGANGAMIGGATGAGIGAIVGAAVPNGLIAESALLGGAIGAPIGIVAGVSYAQYKRTEEIRALRRESKENLDTLSRQADEIDSLREQIALEPAPLEPNEQAKARMYIGPTLGTK